MADLNAALKKLSYGDGLTDAELAVVLELFERLEYDLGTLTRHFDPSYGLAHKAVMRETQALHGFLQAREDHRKMKNDHITDVVEPATDGEKSVTMQWLDGIMNRDKG